MSGLGVQVEPRETQLVDEAASFADQSAGRSPMRIAYDRLIRDPVAMICLGILVFFVLVAALAGPLSDLEGQNISTLHQNLLGQYNPLPTFVANTQHWFGIEANLGRDLFARWVYGARPSLIIGFVCSFASVAVGTVLGLVAGFLGGLIDRTISWLVDFLLSLPFLLMVLAAVPIILTYFGGTGATQQTQANVRLISLIGLFTFFSWPSVTRLVRGEVLSLREREFVQAARAIGVPTRGILFQEMLPNMLGPILVQVTILIPGFIAAEAGLDFLGAGLIEPTASWGQTITEAQTYFQQDPMYLWLPVLGLSLLVLALSLLGDAVADAFNPSTRR